MPRPYSFGSVSLAVETGIAPAVAEAEARIPVPDEHDPFRILIVGDFSGRSRESREPDAAARRPIEVNRDNLDDVLRRLKTGAQLRFKGVPPIALGFDTMEDFEPDRIYERVEQFRSLTAAPSPAATEPSAPSAPLRSLEADAAALTSGSLLDDILAQSEAPSGEAPARKRDEFQEVVERIVAPYSEARETPEQMRAEAQLTERRGILMRAILHHPDFQALEAAWRGLDLLVRRLETDVSLKIYILDMSKDEAAKDVMPEGGLRSSQLYRTLVEQTVATPGAELWAVVAGNYTFDQSSADVALLASLALLARFAGAPFLAQAELTAEAPSEEWQALRNSTNAKYVGLALPRVLARLPYGKSTYVIDSFEFEEMPGKPDHAHYLWANPAFLCALLLGESFSKHGWNFRPGVIAQVDGLPSAQLCCPWRNTHAALCRDVADRARGRVASRPGLYARGVHQEPRCGAAGSLSIHRRAIVGIGGALELIMRG